MRKFGLFIILAIGTIVFIGCASTEKTKETATVDSTYAESKDTPKDAVQKKIDRRIDKLEIDRRSKFRLNNLLGGR